ncbi:MAG: ABC transporter ATP-binding protein [Eubacterium sp.]|nr:ABC transporter ATP-binding protein [Eubacterium sp.]
MKPENAIEVKNVTKKFRVYQDKGHTLKEKTLFRGRRAYEERLVLDGISFEVEKGEALGLIGHNGCGKSTTLKLLTRIMYPDSGSIEMCGRVSSLIELGAGFHPDMSGRENIYINASIFGLTKREIDARMEDIIAFSELGEYLDNPVRTYSSGMYMRLAFSVAINVDADILLIDEILAVGDANFQAKCFDKLREIKAKGTTVVLVTHDTSAIEGFCKKAVWMNQGKIAFQGKSGETVDAYLAFMNGKKITELQKEEQRKKCLEETKKMEAAKIKEQQAEDGSKNTEQEIDYEANHFGRMHIVIERAEMVNEEGKVTAVFRTGENLKIKIYYQVKQPLKEYVFGVGIYNLNGENIYGNNTQIDRICIPHTAEKGCVTYTLDKLPLLSGKYILNVAIVDADGVPMDFYRNYCTFDVVSKDRSTGYFSIEHSWEIA